MKGKLHGSVSRSLETLFGGGSVTGMTDGQLLEQFLARRDEGAETAFSGLVARHGPMVWNVCRSILFDSHMAEDAFQATFMILVKKAGSIRRRDTLASWLYGVARRVALRARRNAARRESAWGHIADMKASSVPDPSHREEVEALYQELDRLPARYRTALVLCHLEGHTHAEAARLLACPPATVSIRVSRARERLRSRLARRGLGLSAFAGVALGSETARAALPGGLADSTTQAALSIGAGKSLTAEVVPAAVAQLTEGVLRTMTAHKLTIAATSLLVVGLVPAGFGLFVIGQLGRPNSGAPAPGAAPAAAGLSADDENARSLSAENLKRIGMAMHNFGSQSPTLTLPAAAISKDGKPLLSWRVALLPYLEQQALYQKFHLDEPWDSAHNKPLIDEIPAVYAPVVNKGEPKGSTYCQVFFGPGALFEGNEGTRIRDVTDGLSNTLLAVEAAKAVPWTKPEDVPFDRARPLPRLGADRGANQNLQENLKAQLALLETKLEEKKKEWKETADRGKIELPRQDAQLNFTEVTTKYEKRLTEITRVDHDLIEAEAMLKTVEKNVQRPAMERENALRRTKANQQGDKFPEIHKRLLNAANGDQANQDTDAIRKLRAKVETLKEQRDSLLKTLETKLVGANKASADSFHLIMLWHDLTSILHKMESVRINLEQLKFEAQHQSDQGFHVLFGDGSVAFMKSTIDDATLRALITPHGGEVIPADSVPTIPPGGGLIPVKNVRTAPRGQ